MSAGVDTPRPVVSTPRPSRREVLRERTAAEIREVARERLRTTSAADLSLRAVARDMGLSAPALYRYYDGRDALLEALCVDAYEGLTAALETAAAGHAGDGRTAAARRLGAAALAYRRWGLDHAHEWSLVFGAPVPGWEPGEDSPLQQVGGRFGEVFLALLVDVVGDGSQVRLLPPGGLPPELAARLDAVELGPPPPLGPPRPPAELVQAWISCWARLHGHVSLEVFGHLGFALGDGDGEALYRSLLAELAAAGIGDVDVAWTLPAA